MAIARYKNITEIPQTVYDESMTPFYIVPGGTVELESKMMDKVGGFEKVVEKAQAVKKGE